MSRWRNIPQDGLLLVLEYSIDSCDAVTSLRLLETRVAQLLRAPMSKEVTDGLTSSTEWYVPRKLRDVYWAALEGEWCAPTFSYARYFEEFGSKGSTTKPGEGTQHVDPTALLSELYINVTDEVRLVRTSRSVRRALGRRARRGVAEGQLAGEAPGGGAAGSILSDTFSVWKLAVAAPRTIQCNQLEINDDGGSRKVAVPAAMRECLDWCSRMRPRGSLFVAATFGTEYAVVVDDAAYRSVWFCDFTGGELASIRAPATPVFLSSLADGGVSPDTLKEISAVGFCGSPFIMAFGFHGSASGAPHPVAAEVVQVAEAYPHPATTLYVIPLLTPLRATHFCIQGLSAIAPGALALMTSEGAMQVTRSRTDDPSSPVVSLFDLDKGSVACCAFEGNHFAAITVRLRVYAGQFTLCSTSAGLAAAPDGATPLGEYDSAPPPPIRELECITPLSLLLLGHGSVINVTLKGYLMTACFTSFHRNTHVVIADACNDVLLGIVHEHDAGLGPLYPIAGGVMQRQRPATTTTTTVSETTPATTSIIEEPDGGGVQATGTEDDDDALLFLGFRGLRELDTLRAPNFCLMVAERCPDKKDTMESADQLANAYVAQHSAPPVPPGGSSDGTSDSDSSAISACSTPPSTPG